MQIVQLIEIVVVFAFFVLLLSAIYLLVNIYICDGLNCKPFTQAENKGARGTKEYVEALMGEFFNDGMWPLPYIGAAILTPLSLWFIGFPITILNFAILFFVSFATFYFILSFFGHHYVNFIVDYATDYIRGTLNTPAPAPAPVPSTHTTETPQVAPQQNLPPQQKSQVESNKTHSEMVGSKVMTDERGYDTTYSDDGQVCMSQESSRSDRSGFRSFIDGGHVTFATSIY